MTFDDAHSGAPTYVHAGLTQSVLNEAMAWAVVAITERFAIPTGMSTDFRRPLRIGQGYTFHGTVADADDRHISATGEVRDDAGRTHVTAQATFQPISDTIAARLRARVAEPANGTAS